MLPVPSVPPNNSQRISGTGPWHSIGTAKMGQDSVKQDGLRCQYPWRQGLLQEGSDGPKGTADLLMDYGM
eukprot:scaffold185133_cov22-Tisochrysis_lutea.AAC.1